MFLVKKFHYVVVVNFREGFIVVVVVHFNIQYFPISFMKMFMLYPFLITVRYLLFSMSFIQHIFKFYHRRSYRKNIKSRDGHFEIKMIILKCPFLEIKPFLKSLIKIFCISASRLRKGENLQRHV